MLVWKVKHTTEKEKSTTQNEKCAICLGRLRKKRTRIIGQCGHELHRNCWYQFVNRTEKIINNCPLCRQIF